MRHLLLVAPLLGLIIACTGNTPRCLRSNCNGCCDLNSMCRAGNEQFACGFGANACNSCAMNEACAAGACVPGDGGFGGGSGGGNGSDGGCSGATCGGCCDTSGVCRGGNANTSCGSQGRSCASCPSGQACQFSDAGMFGCAPFVCTGCISTTGTCLVGTAVGACGAGGGMCQACLTGQSCVMGTCQMVATCSASSCAGCCNGTSCVDPPTTQQCGRMGAPCAACTGTDTCNAGICGTNTMTDGGGGGCGAATCPMGCCDLIFNSCVPGDNNLACGKGGVTCLPCPSFLQLSCKMQMCAP